MRLEVYKNDWNLPRFEILRSEQRFDGSSWMYLNLDSTKKDPSHAICIPSFEAHRVSNESYTLLLNDQWNEEVPGKQVVQVFNSDWIKEIERQSFEGILKHNQLNAVHYIIADSEWVYEFISYDEPQLIELA